MPIYADYHNQVSNSENLEQLMTAMDGACERTVQLLEQIDARLDKIKLTVDTCMMVPSFSGFVPLSNLKNSYVALAEFRLQVAREFWELQEYASKKVDVFTAGPVN